MPAPEHPMLPFLVDLEAPYVPGTPSDYEPQELVRHALRSSDYWASLALRWLDQGVSIDGLEDVLREVEGQPERRQELRHHARRLRRGVKATD